MKPASVNDYRELARRRLPRFLFDYIDGGSYGETTLRNNIADLEQVALRQRILRDVAKIDLTTTLFGQSLKMPVVLGPVGLAGLNARRGETQAVRAADAAGVPFCLSTVSICPLKEVAAAAAKPLWFQLYMMRDRGFMRELLAEALTLGCSTLVFTADLPVAGSRYRDHRSGLTGAPGLPGTLRRFAQAARRPAWALDVGLGGAPHTLGNVVQRLRGKTALEDFFAWMGVNFDPSVTWKDLDWIRESWTGPLIIKGVLDPHDAIAAVDLGANGIVVSNHGGRQLDGAISTVRALPGVVEAVGDRLSVLVDGGVRSGLDVVRMLALGAKGVLLGRAWAYALGGAGQAGVAHVLALIEAEIRVAMALTGCVSVADLDRRVIETL